MFSNGILHHMTKKLKQQNGQLNFKRAPNNLTYLRWCGQEILTLILTINHTQNFTIIVPLLNMSTLKLMKIIHPILNSKNVIINLSVFMNTLLAFTFWITKSLICWKHFSPATWWIYWWSDFWFLLLTQFTIVVPSCTHWLFCNIYT